MRQIPRATRSGLWLEGLAALWLATGCDHDQAPTDDTVQVPTPPRNEVPVQGIDSSLEARLTSTKTVESLFATSTSNVQVLVRGTVVKFLSDDVEGDKHQRFILKLSSGQTLLIAHNIDLATRVPASALNSIAYVYGEYEWNSEGGVVHWTHKDPDNSHAAGWIQFDGDRYW